MGIPQNIASVMILAVYIAVGDSENITCAANQVCMVNCTQYGTSGCKGDIIDGTEATSLTVSCSSSSAHLGGCQFTSIYCPKSYASSLCNINCIDYYGCYLSTIYSSKNTDLNILCDVEDNSCSKTTVHANNSNNLNISCYGSGALSVDKAICSNMKIYATNIENQVNIKCDGDYACSHLFVNATNANIVNLYSRGKYAMNYGSFHAETANSFDLFCGSEESEYGCYHTSIYIPSYISLNKARSNIKCEGHGCYNNLNIYSLHGALDLNIYLNGCNECDTADKCVDSWTFNCGVSYSNSISFYGEICQESNDNQDLCDCKEATNIIQTNYINDNKQCDIFEADYICKSGVDCIIDCSTEFKDGCYDKIIDGSNSTSLLLKCVSPSLYSDHGGCESSHIYCPQGTQGNQCHIECWETSSCDNAEINSLEINGMVNLTCIEKDSCSGTTIYATNTHNMLINCIETDACDALNLYGENAKNLTIKCLGDADYSSYSACHQINVYANYSDIFKLQCEGDYSCYQPHIEAYFANQVIIEAIGESSIYYGAIYGNYVKKSMHIMCKSEYREYGCKNTKFYIPSKKTNIECEGHGCYYLSLYAKNGFADIANLIWNGCAQCTSFDYCLNDWSMACGNSFATATTMYSSYCYPQDICGCNTFRTLALNTFDSGTSAAQCDILRADIQCTAKDSGSTICELLCSASNCKSKIIGAADKMTSMAVECNSYESCSDTTIICPTIERSECNISCTNSLSCSGLTVYGGNNGIININCDYSDITCKSINIYGDDAYKINFVCSALSCQYTKIYGINAENINIDCTGSKDSSYYSYTSSKSCYNIQIFGENVKNTANLQCNGYYSCYYGNFHFDNASKAIIKSSGDHALYNGHIYTNNTLSTTITCDGRNGTSSGCYLSTFQINPVSTKLNCIGYGCYEFTLKAVDGFNNLNQITFDGCLECLDVDTCISSWTLDCGKQNNNGYNNYYYDSSDSNTFYGTSCSYDYNGNDDCKCSEIIKQVSNGWDKQNKQYECIPNADYECKEGDNADCRYECDSSSSQCSNKIFVGLNASSLSVLCDYYSSSYYYSNGVCSDSIIYCPITPDSDCNIKCKDEYCCDGVKIQSHTKNNINIICDKSSSCRNMIIYGNNANTINVKCNGGNDASDYYDGACYGLTMYGNNANTINIQCNGQYSCYHMLLHINNANNIDITINDYNQAINSGTIYASNATSFNLHCIGTQNSDDSSWYNYNGCYGLTAYLPESNSINLDCKGIGCDTITLYRANGFSDINSITFDLCGCNDNNNVDLCISSWSLYCDPYGIDSWSYSTSYYSCSYDDVCDCSDLRNKIDSGTIKCDHDNTPNISIGGIVGIVIGVIFAIVCMVTIYCRICRKKRARNRINRNGEAGPQNGDALINAAPFNEGESEAIEAQQIALQPISYIPLPDNIQQQIQNEPDDQVQDEEGDGLEDDENDED